MGKKNVMINLGVSLLTQVITLILGLVLPRLILLTWGSEYNGFLSSVTNILRYLSLLEIGFNVATIQALYKTVGQNDRAQTSIVVRTSQHYYHKISFVYAAIVLAISLIYPLIIHSTISYGEMVLIILLQGAVGVINFAFRASYQQLLNAEGKYYIISLITLFTTVLTYASKILAIQIFDSVLIMQVMGVFVIILQILIYVIYFDKQYAWLDKKAKIQKELLANRQYYFTQQIAGLIFNSTDTFVLSIFCGLKVASVYAVYNLVYTALAQLISLMRGSTNFILGQSYHKDKVLFEKIYDGYSAAQSMAGGIFASISMVLIINFVQVYTRGVNDINYVDFMAALLFSFNLMLECARGASLASANIAGKAPDTTWRYVMEAGINIVSSLILVQFFGIYGVLLGTALAGLYRTTDSICYTNRHVFSRSPFGEFKMVLSCFALFFIITFLSYTTLHLHAADYITLLLYAILTGVIVTGLFAVTFYLFNRKRVCVLLQELKERS